MMSCRLLENRVDVLEAGCGAIEKRSELQWIGMQHAEHHVDLGVGILLGFVQLARQQHARGDVPDRAQHVLDPAGSHHAVEVELQVACLLAAAPVVHAHFELSERVDALHQVLVGAVAPEQLDEFHGRVERLGAHLVPQQLLERQAGEIRTTEQMRQRLRPDGADAIVGIQQKEPLAHRGQDVAGLLLGGARGVLLAGSRQLQVRSDQTEHQHREHTDQQQQPQTGGRGGCLCLQRAAYRGQLTVQGGRMPCREQLCTSYVCIEDPAAAREGAAGRGIRVGLAPVGEHRGEHRGITVPEPGRGAHRRGVERPLVLERAEVPLEAAHAGGELGMHVPGVLECVESLAQCRELLGHHGRIRLELARLLQRRDAGADLRGEPETDDQHQAHHRRERDAGGRGEQPAISVNARQLHGIVLVSSAVRNGSWCALARRAAGRGTSAASTATGGSHRVPRR